MDKNKNKHLFPKFSKFDHVVFTQSSLNCEDRFLQRFVMENKATRLVRHLNGGIDDPELSNVIMEYFCGNEDSDDGEFTLNMLQACYSPRVGTIDNTQD
ncbi:MAG: hypothetical protein V2I33_16880 [Kangiellaceae bacterium]|jgi:hypothetical protein|nr:hypothetical protein [Kangiellaceae bacterium]